MKWCLLLLVSSVLAAQTPDQQLAFADDLFANGDDVFALLEYKRFAFHYPNHAQTPHVLQRLGRLYVSATGNTAAAKQATQTIIDKYPNSPLVADAKQFIDFLEVNSDFGGQPLQLWMKAESLGKQKRFDDSIAVLERIVSSFPTARLADDALFQIATIQHERLGKTADARETFARLARLYPKSDLLVQAEFQAASALGSVEGKETDAATALRAFANKHPDSPQAKQALEQALVLERKGFVLKRQFEASFVRKYTVKRAAQVNDEYQADIEVSAGLSQREVQATLEDALVKESAKRKQPEDKVRIHGYFNYPITKAGNATWTPGEEPAYQIDERETKSLLLDFGLDILRK